MTLYPELAKAYVQAFLATSMGQMCSSFIRVFLATVLGCWMQAGGDLPVKSGDLHDWVVLAVNAAIALVIANYLGPWEKRYGRKKG